MNNENDIVEIENDSADVSSEEHETVVVDPAAAPSGDQSAGTDGGDPVTDQAAPDHDGIGESSQDIGDGSGADLSGSDEEADLFVSDVKVGAAVHFNLEHIKIMLIPSIKGGIFYEREKQTFDGERKVLY